MAVQFFQNSSHNMVLDDYKEMAGILGKVKGKILVTINGLPEIREVFKAFSLKEVSLKYSVSCRKPAEGNELIFTNY